MDQEFYRIVIFGEGSLKTRNLIINKKTFYLIAFLLCFLMLFICDYIQVKKHSFDLNRIRQEARLQKTQIQFFMTRIEEVEEQISKLMDFDKRIRIIANLEKNQEAVSFIGMGGTLSTDRYDQLDTQ
jgi:hypothetical protein